jgi:hypothetical protein
VIDMKHRISGKDATSVAMEAAKRGPIRVEPSPDDDSQRAIGSQGALPPLKASAMETTDMVARSASATAIFGTTTDVSALGK